MDELERALREHFGFEKFRPGQREVIEHILARRHTLAVLPTGGGKSLCYQLTAQLLPGVTLVVSPLIALMQDQVEALMDRGFDNVTFLSSALTPSETGRRYHEIEGGRYKLIYVAPERCDSPRFQQLVRNLEIDLVVIDEAHCISQWGHDFRPHYRTLLARVPELKRATLLALTATATPVVQNDIVAALALPAMERVIADFNRPNLRFEVIRVDGREEKEAQLIRLLEGNDEPAIVYASTRKEATAAYQLLQAYGLSVCLYHAGLEPEERAQSQHEFLQGARRIIAATVAFGMGIDKPDIRRVIHCNIPGSLENYYQEVGRAGRDGEPAICTLLYSQPDVRIQRFLIEQAYPDPQVMLHLYGMLREAHPLPVAVSDLVTASRLPEITVNAALQLLYDQHWLQLTPEGKYSLAQPSAAQPKVDIKPLNERRRRANDRLHKMIEYAAGNTCRRAHILNYFGQYFTPPCSGCDVCCAANEARAIAGKPAAEAPAAEANAASDRVARIILQAAADFQGRLGRSLIAYVLCGSRRKRIMELGLERSKHYAALGHHSHDRVMVWIDELIKQQLLRTTAEEYPRLLITEAGRRALAAEALLPLSGFASRSATAQGRGAKARPQQTNAEAVHALTEKLKRWRREKASALSVPAYVILHDSVLNDIAQQQPRTLDELSVIKGIGPSKLESLGAEILALIQSLPTPSQETAAVQEIAPPALSSPPPPSDLRLQIEIWRQGGRQPSVKALLAALDSLYETSREELIVVISVLRDLGVTAATDSLLDLLHETTDGNLLTAICAAIGPLGVSEAEPDLLQLLEDQRAGVRRAAARALGHLRSQAARTRLEQLANEDRSESVRLAARAAITLLEDGAIAN